MLLCGSKKGLSRSGGREQVTREKPDKALLDELAKAWGVPTKLLCHRSKL